MTTRDLKICFAVGVLGSGIGMGVAIGSIHAQTPGADMTKNEALMKDFPRAAVVELPEGETFIGILPATEVPKFEPVRYLTVPSRGERPRVIVVWKEGQGLVSGRINWHVTVDYFIREH